MVVVAATVVALGGAVSTEGVGARPAQQSPDSEIGITADTIRIAVIADGDNPIRPGVFQGAIDGVKAGARYLNAHGGIAGRKIEVEFLDSHLSPDESRSALVKACEDDFAIVGTMAVFMSNVEPMVTCPDKSGNATGLPDMPNLQTEIAHQCSGVSFPVVPTGLHCDTRNDEKVLFDIRVGAQKYYLRTFGNLHGPALAPSDLKSTLNAYVPTVRAAEQVGIKDDGDINMSLLATQSEYTPVMQAVKQQDSNIVQSGLDYVANLQLRREATIQGVTSVKVWDCTLACYDRRLIEQGGPDVEGQYLWIFYPPFEEAKYNTVIATFVKAIGGRANADSFGIQSWAGMLFLRDVLNNVVKADGENGITRARFLEEARKIHDFTADGLLGPSDVGAGKLNGCFVLLQVRDGQFVRVFPKKKGTVNCATKPVEVRYQLQ